MAIRNAIHSDIKYRATFSPIGYHMTNFRANKALAIVDILLC